MRHYNHPLKPTVIMPTTATPIVVQSADDTNIVFENPTAAALSAAFLVQYDHTIQQAAYGGVPIEFYWAGLAPPAAGSGRRRYGSADVSRGTATLRHCLLVQFLSMPICTPAVLLAFSSPPPTGTPASPHICRLYNVTDSMAVATLDFISQAQVAQEVAIGFPSGAKIYECEVYLDQPPHPAIRSNSTQRSYRCHSGETGAYRDRDPKGEVAGHVDHYQR